MKVLIFSGLLYLIVISIILVLKPELMFAKDGTWKEFGIGRNTERYTWIPFWLFSIVCAIMSYMIVLTIMGDSNKNTIVNKSISLQRINITGQNDGEGNDIEQSIDTNNIENIITNKSVGNKNKSINMKPGYYILDINETTRKGIPKYIYLGPEAPNLVYKNE